MVEVSVIIPCYNHGTYILEAIESVEKYPEKASCEIIIVNDGSTDAYTKQVLNRLESENYIIINQHNQGLAVARNNGIKMAKGQYIIPLDSDNKIRPNYITRGIKVLDNHPDVGIVYADSCSFGEASRINLVPEFELKKMLLINYIDACALFRKKVWEEVGGYDEKMPVMGYEDWDFWILAAKKGWKFYHLNEVGFDYRVRKKSMISTINLTDNQRMIISYFIKKHFDLFTPEDFGEILAEMRFAQFKLEVLNKKVEDLKDYHKKVLKNNNILLKVIAKNILNRLIFSQKNL